MDRFKQIETFVAVAARGSLSAAALAEGWRRRSWAGASTRWRSAWA